MRPSWFPQYWFAWVGMFGSGHALMVLIINELR
jgi:hypothetical protein